MRMVCANKQKFSLTYLHPQHCRKSLAKRLIETGSLLTICVCFV